MANKIYFHHIPQPYLSEEGPERQRRGVFDSAPSSPSRSISPVLEELFCVRPECSLEALAMPRQLKSFFWIPSPGLYTNFSTIFLCRYYCDYCDTYLTHDSVSFNLILCALLCNLSVLLEVVCLLVVVNDVGVFFPSVEKI